MGRGLSPLQRDILGVAYEVNAYTQGGVAAVKDDDAPVDIVTPLAVFAVYRVAPWKWGTVDAAFVRTPEVNSAFAACSRAITRLCTRKLLAWQNRRPLTAVEAIQRVDYPNPIEPGRVGYVLTTDGIGVAAAYRRPVPALAEAVRFFEIVTVPRADRSVESWRDVLVTTARTPADGNQ